MSIPFASYDFQKPAPLEPLFGRGSFSVLARGLAFRVLLEPLKTETTVKRFREYSQLFLAVPPRHDKRPSTIPACSARLLMLA